MGVVLAACAVAGCGSRGGAPPGGSIPVSPGASSPAPTSGAGVARASGAFAVYSAQNTATAITYDRAQVPAGATATVTSTPAGQGTQVELQVAGLLPNHAYGAHVHTRRCGATGEDAGPHYQNRNDPHQPSTDPAYANPQNEVWLDFTTNAQGAADVKTTVPWRFRADGAHSVVIHQTHTMTGPGQAGVAGARLACVTVPF
ncbi:superoxide dismutase family protein [Gandjariella thermophila]|uniref:superoxide dismutase family protein n=1 Tax=Gandjariella thermophila TaxID=1931992 RepID=UPI001CEFAE1D|nr:superoxide dismutase family protein [Gandjariella thermophila]